MSLIDEALKRARDQKPPEAAAAATRPRPTPDPWAYAPLPHARRRLGGRGSVIAGSIGAIAAVAAAGVWLARSGGLPAGLDRRPEAPRAAASGKPSSPPPVAASAPAPALSRPAAGRPGSPEAAATKPGAERAGPARPPAPRRNAPAPAAPAAAAGTAEVAPQLLPQPASRAFDGRTYVGALVAPNGSRVELGGIVYSETNASALLNGRILPVGGVVEGLTVSAIEEDRIELTGDGVTVHLTLR